VNSKSPSSGDCEVAAERALLETEVAEFGSEMAAPVEIEDPNWHRSEPLLKECEWKQGDSAASRSGKDAGIGRLPSVGNQACS